MLPIQPDEPGGGAFSALLGGSVAEAVTGLVGEAGIDPKLQAGMFIGGGVFSMRDDWR